MESKIVHALRLKYEPVAILWSDEKPVGAMEFQEGKWGCIMWLIASAAKGRTSACGRKTFGCIGGAVGMGFGPQYKNFPGGEEVFCRFLSTGVAGWKEGEETLEQIKPFLRDETYDNFVHGERYQKSPEEVRRFIACLPITDIPARYVIFKPLSAVDPQKDAPVAVIFLADPDQLSALVILANYGRGHNENVIIPHAAGCQTIGIYSFAEAKKTAPRAVVGLTDLSARAAIRKQLGANLMSFTVPFAMFAE
ncbi:MAG: DUF169 domain-containing protein, partial [Smithellaceae bacterium]|nr:DUF169 domain-containing protein [Smithellaceae bacterium]